MAVHLGLVGLASLWYQVGMKTTHSFSFMGRRWQLIRRATGRRAATASTPWSYRMTVGGKRVLISTRTAMVTDAMELAKARIRAVMSGRLEALDVGRMSTGKGKVPTFDEVGRIYAGARVVRAATAAGNMRSLERLVRVVLGVKEVGSMKIDVLSREVGERWLASRQGLESPDYGSLGRANAGANSVLRQAQAVFARRHRRIWEGWRLPAGVDGFLGVRMLSEAAPRYVPISEAVIARMDAEAERVAGGWWPDGIERPSGCEAGDLWAVNRAIRLMGLRDSEVLAMKSSWLIDHGGRLFLEVAARPGEFVPKGHCGRVLVPKVLESDWRAKLGHERAVFLIADGAGPSARRQLIYRAHSRWVRGFIGAGRRKTNHELRKHAGSLVAMKFNSWEAAARFLREDLETAKKHYLELLQPVGLEVEDLTYEEGPRIRAVR